MVKIDQVMVKLKIIQLTFDYVIIKLTKNWWKRLKKKLNHLILEWCWNT